MTTIEFISIALALTSLIFAIKVWLQYDHDIQRTYDTLNNKITRHKEYSDNEFKSIFEVSKSFDDRIRSLEREIDHEDDV